MLPSYFFVLVSREPVLTEGPDVLIFRFHTDCARVFHHGALHSILELGWHTVQ